ncbi:MAG: DUF4149 domain-containing protein [Oceanicaulis sp.]
MPVITTLSELLALFTASALFGAMVFFPLAVAPTVFRALAPESAGRFLRALFPAYYAFVITTSGVCCFALLLIGESWAVAAGAIALSTLALRTVLVPRINAWRDANLEGDPGAKEKFDAGHRASVIVNLVQMGLAAGLVWVTASI